ncbi:hypothetical protein GYMLUDRAFT_36550 [Collybiopsis luxurians FD-317 M1]|nr:hypothetical protein GYMLUDRAFT_36550 [Collybiopsis luxurians FD-317 M1]
MEYPFASQITEALIVKHWMCFRRRLQPREATQMRSLILDLGYPKIRKSSKKADLNDSEVVLFDF